MAACGSSSSDAPGSEPTTAITGSIFAGPVNGASVTVKNTSGTNVAGPVMTGSDGTYSINIPNSALSGDLVIEASSGTFPDEATAGASTTAGTLSAHVLGGSLTAGSSVSIDPSSTIIQRLVAGGKSLGDAKTAFNTAFGYNPDTSVTPVFANISTSATTDKRLAGLRAAVFSQLVKDLGLTADKQFELIAAIADDLSDGTLDGMKSAVSLTVAGTALKEDIGNKFEQAFINFLASAYNKTKLTPDKIGTLPFAKTALTNNYKVEYIPGMMAAMQGKTTFKIRASSISGGGAVSGATITLNPIMYMSTMSHSTPVETCTESSTAGTYDCTAYYLMAGGPGMGYWKLQVGVNGETAKFFPSVGMSMGDTTKAALKHKDDTISLMGMMKPRQYTLFKDSLSAGMGGIYTFKIFIASQESMMSWPKLYTGMTLSGGSSPLTVNTLSVQASTDATNWTLMTEVSAGHFSVSGLTGLTSGVQGNIYVKLNINGNDYVNNATGDATATGALTYQTFAVTPGGM